MINFQAVASKTISDNLIMAGRTKVSTETIIKENPSHVTIMAFDFAKGSQGSYAVVELLEYPQRYYPCGMCLSNICRGWCDAYEGDIITANNDLKESGGVKVKLERVRTSKGNQFIKVTIL